MYRKLYRSSKDKMLGGVAGGLAEYFDIDPTLVRVIFIITLFLGGTGVIAYIILWILVPEEPITFPGQTSTEINPDDPLNPETGTETDPAFTPVRKRPSNGPAVAGVALVVIGLLFLLDNFFPRINFGDYWPLILVAIGAGLLLSSRKGGR
jgi:phage shock protein C